MAPRSSTIYLAITGSLTLILSGLLLHASIKVRESEGAIARNAALVRKLELTDLCLFTEANHTRHPSVADVATPFQDGLMTFDHFPTGALAGPPPHLVKPWP